MVQLQDIIRHAHKTPFHRYVGSPSGQESAEVHIFFNRGEDALRLNGTVDPKQDPFVCGNLFLHRLTLLDEVFGNIQPFHAVFQRRFVRLLLTNALSFDLAILAVRAFIDGHFLDVSRLGFPLLHRCCLQFLSLGTGIFILFRIVGHIFSAANIILVLALLFLLMVRWLYKQRKLFAAIHIVVVFLTFIPGIYHYSLHWMDIAQLLQKWNKSLGIRPVRGDIITDDIQSRMLYTLLASCFVSHLNNTPKPDSPQEPGLCIFRGGCLFLRQPPLGFSGFLGKL